MARIDLLQAMREKANPAAAVDSNKQVNSSPIQEVRPPSRAGKRQIAAYFPLPVQKQLKLMAVEKDTTVQNLLSEALNDLFAKYGRPEIAPGSEHAI